MLGYAMGWFTSEWFVSLNDIPDMLAPLRWWMTFDLIVTFTTQTGISWHTNIQPNQHIYHCLPEVWCVDAQTIETSRESGFAGVLES